MWSRTGRPSRVEVDTGRPVIIEVKLAAKTDRRQALTQILGYAAYLRRLDSDGVNTVLRGYLAQERICLGRPRREGGCAESDLRLEAFQQRFENALADGHLRAVIALDDAPSDVVDLVGYLQDVTSDRLALDLGCLSSGELEPPRLGGDRLFLQQFRGGYGPAREVNRRLWSPTSSQLLLCGHGPLRSSGCHRGSRRFGGDSGHVPVSRGRWVIRPSRPASRRVRGGSRTRRPLPFPRPPARSRSRRRRWPAS